METGSSSMKMLSLPTEPRQAALAGAGIASPHNAGEAFRNPLAGVADTSLSLSFSKTNLSDLIGASRMSMLAHTMYGNWHLTTGMESLNYDKIQEYTADGLTADGLSFSSGMVAMQFGIARTFNSMSAGLIARYANHNIYDYYGHGILFDGGVKYNLHKYFDLGAVFNNFGWIISNAKEHEIAPLSFQAGVTASLPLLLGFTGAFSADIYRRTDFEREFRTGLELLYRELLSFKLGFPISDNENNALSAGFAVKIGSIAAEYAYQNRAVLEANHVFGISLYFY
ncbi:MAG: hypothetical protein LBH25_11520 [Fibromonadaceae bacterium]|nr:hypothetical protein [Fibromonadaceae bacterium]